MKQNTKIKPSLPKGTRDFLPEQMFRRQFVFSTVRAVFERYGYQPLETPSIEKLEVLSGKYGVEGEQLIFKVLRRGTGLEELRRGRDAFTVHRYADLVEEALRYDLTVPLSRVVAMYYNELQFPFKRYQIQPVWRADRPQRGRYREFYQCDVDTVGSTSLLADAEAIAIVYDVLATLGFKRFNIRLNNRKILNGILDFAGVPPERANSVFIAMDKLDKIGLDGVKAELKARDVSQNQIKRVLRVLEISGPTQEVLAELSQSFAEIESLREGTEELQEISGYLGGFGLPESSFKIDLFLVRGLGYYTGPVFESVVEEPRIGSLSGGGRYDKLIGMFLGRDIPATGTAFGIERIIDVMSQLDMFPEAQTNTKVLVTVFDKATVPASLAFAQDLRKAGVKTECFLGAGKMKKQLSFADRKKIPYVAIIGPDEVEAGKVTIKDLRTGEQKTLGQEKAVRFLVASA